MGVPITDIIDVPSLIGEVRVKAGVIFADDLISRLLPLREVDDIEFELRNIETPALQVARYRAWDTPVPLGKRPGFATVRGEVMPLGLKMLLNERELARFNKLRAGLPGGTLQDVYDDALVTAQASLWRIQNARGDVLVDGKVTLNENGVNLEADFGVPAAHIVTAATAWTDTTNAVPITNLKSWQSTYRSNNAGRNPAAWIASTAVIADLQANAQIKNLALVPGGAQTPAFVSQDAVAEVMRAHGIAPFVPYDGESPNASTGVLERLIGERKLLGVPAADLGEVFVGPHPMALDFVGRGILRIDQAPGVMTWVESETDPASIKTISEAVALPVLRSPNALFVATV